MLEWKARRTVQQSSNVVLRQALLSGYDDLVGRLTRRLKSSDQAYEAVQDTFLKLESASDVGPVASPKAYLFQVALNLARDRRRADARRLSAAEIDDLTEIADETPSPSQIVEARSDLAAFTRALGELPARRRAILEASLIHETPRKEIARRFGVSERTIDFELKRALEHARAALRQEN